MTPLRVTLGALGTAVVILGLLALGERGCRDSHIRKADEAHGEALGHAQQATAEDTKAAANAVELADLKAEKDRLLAELGRLKASHGQAAVPTPAIPAIGRAADDFVIPEPLGLVESKQDEVIRAQAAYISRLEDQVSTLTNARNQWKAAYEAEARRSAALELALKAQKAAGVAASAKWGMLGAALGFVGAKL